MEVWLTSSGLTSLLTVTGVSRENTSTRGVSGREYERNLSDQSGCCHASFDTGGSVLLVLLLLDESLRLLETNMNMTL